MHLFVFLLTRYYENETALEPKGTIPIADIKGIEEIADDVSQAAG